MCEDYSLENPFMMENSHVAEHINKDYIQQSLQKINLGTNHATQELRNQWVCFSKFGYIWSR